jgi:hypothetical protein
MTRFRSESRSVGGLRFLVDIVIAKRRHEVLKPPLLLSHADLFLLLIFANDIQTHGRLGVPVVHLAERALVDRLPSRLDGLSDHDALPQGRGRVATPESRLEVGKLGLGEVEEAVTERGEGWSSGRCESHVRDRCDSL